MAYEELNRLFMHQCFNSLTDEVAENMNKTDSNVKGIKLSQGHVSFIKSRAEHSMDKKIKYVS